MGASQGNAPVTGSGISDCELRNADWRGHAGIAGQTAGFSEHCGVKHHPDSEFQPLTKKFTMPAFTWRLVSIVALTVLFPIASASAQVSQPSVGAAAAPPKDEIKSIAVALRGNRAALMKLKPTPAQGAQIAANPDDAAKLNAYAG